MHTAFGLSKNTRGATNSEACGGMLASSLRTVPVFHLYLVIRVAVVASDWSTGLLNNATGSCI
jgi:hypothetical protein